MNNGTRENKHSGMRAQGGGGGILMSYMSSLLDLGSTEPYSHQGGGVVCVRNTTLPWPSHFG